MIQSMTAFARSEAAFIGGNVVCEIRSVNSRYLEPHFKLPESLRNVEPILRDMLRKQLGRGKIEIMLRLQIDEGSQSDLQINHSLASALLSASSEIAEKHGNIAAINPLDVLRWPGVIRENTIDPELIKNAASNASQAAIKELINSRAREGESLKGLIEQRLDAIEVICQQTRAILPDIMATQEQRLRDKLAEIETKIDAERIEQELVILLQKADVDEELDRLDTHANEVRRILKKGGHCGRKLDFLMQELNREANTLSSKSQAHSTTQNAVELKVLIEQMREQIQNIE